MIKGEELATLFPDPPTIVAPDGTVSAVAAILGPDLETPKRFIDVAMSGDMIVFDPFGRCGQVALTFYLEGKIFFHTSEMVFRTQVELDALTLSEGLQC